MTVARATTVYSTAYCVDENNRVLLYVSVYDIGAAATAAEIKSDTAEEINQ